MNESRRCSILVHLLVTTIRMAFLFGIKQLPMTNSWRQIMVPSVTGALRKIHFDIERQQPIEQRRLAVIMPRLEAAVADLAAVLQQTKPQQRSQDSGPPWRRPTCPKSRPEWQAPG